MNRLYGDAESYARAVTCIYAARPAMVVTVTLAVYYASTRVTVLADLVK